MTRVYALRDSVRHAVSTIRRGARPPFLNTITQREREREREEIATRMQQRLGNKAIAKLDWPPIVDGNDTPLLFEIHR